MDLESNQPNPIHLLATEHETQDIALALMQYLTGHIPSITSTDKLYTDYDGNTFSSASSEIISGDPNIASLVNAMNILQQGHVQIGPWETSTQVTHSAISTSLPTILIVDDEDVTRMTTREILEEKIKAQYDEAENGEEALAYCKASTPDLVILDMMMPVRDGFSTGKELKRLGIPFIAMTSLDSIDSIQKIIETGSLSYVLKSTPHSQLIGSVLSALHHVNSKKILIQQNESNLDIYTAKGALAAYLSISPNQAYDIIREISRDNHSNSKDTSITINQFLDFIGKATTKHQAQSKRLEKLLNKRRKD